MIYLLIILFFIPFPIIFEIRYIDKFEIFLYKKKLIKNKEKDFKKNLSKYKDIKILLKPWIKINLNLRYGLDDAAATAICYGIIFSIIPVIKNFLSKNFHIKSISPHISLDYKNMIFNLSIKCIIFINFAQIIVNLLHIFYTNLKRGVIYGKPSHRQFDEEHYGKS